MHEGAEGLVSSPVVERRPGSMEKVPRPVLPPGVTERDLEMFKKAQEKASQVSMSYRVFCVSSTFIIVTFWELIVCREMMPFEIF